MPTPTPTTSCQPPRPKLAITGASGFVGQELAPLLRSQGAELLLIGRDPSRLERQFPGIPTGGYDDLSRAAGFDAVIHLAVLNNDANQPPEAFRQVNVDLLMEAVERARAAGIPRFVNVSSFHVLDPGNRTPYAESKREALRRLEEVPGIAVTNVFLPLVYGRRWGGRLATLNRLPRPVAAPLFTILAALKPTVDARRVADAVLEIVRKSRDGDVVVSDMQRENWAYCIGKRAIDLFFALAVVGLLWWALLLIWAAIRLHSKGPGLFAQERVGSEGRSFTCYKFRTMQLGTAQVGTHEAPASAVTPLGRFLRAAKLDELPQIINILRGEMSLVGPRPCLPVQRQLVEERRARGVLKVTPGITGLAQVNGVDMSDPERLARWDERYIAQRSLLLDLKLILATATGKGRGDRIVSRP